MPLDRGDPPKPSKYISNLKLTNYSRSVGIKWMASVGLGQLDFTVITRQFGFRCRQVYIGK